jgi:hypothetical protein
MRNALKKFVMKAEGRDLVSVEGRIILKCISKKQSVRV